MNCINRKYYESREENSNAFWRYLDCIEKVAYFQFQNSSVDLEEIFCDDLNIQILEKDDKILICRNCLKPIEQCFDVNRVEKLDNPLMYIRDKIDNGYILGINTYFYDIPNFIWYQVEACKDSEHVCMIVGYDENNVWLSDVPTNIKSEYLLDKSLTVIPNRKMEEYLEKRCRIMTFQEKSYECDDNYKLTNLIKRMLQEYYTQPYNEDDGVVWKGKIVFDRLLYLLQLKDPRVLRMELYHGEHMATIISGRRELLRRNILKKYGRTKETENVLKSLEICAHKWEVLGYKILKEILKNGVYDANETDIYQIYESEKQLMDYMENFIETIK